MTVTWRLIYSFCVKLTRIWQTIQDSQSALCIIRLREMQDIYRTQTLTDQRTWWGKLWCIYLVPPHTADRSKWHVNAKWQNSRDKVTRHWNTDNNGDSMKTATCWIVFCVCAVAPFALQRAFYRLARRNWGRRTGVRAHGKVTAAMASQQQQQYLATTKTGNTRITQHSVPFA